MHYNNILQKKETSFIHVGNVCVFNGKSKAGEPTMCNEKFLTNHAFRYKFITRNFPNSYVVTAGDVQEMKLNAQTKYCSAKHDK